MNRNLVLTSLVTVAFLGAESSSRAALIPPFMVDSVVAIGVTTNTNPPGLPPKPTWATLGTGFFYGYKVKDDPDLSKRQYEIYLVTAGHVISEFRTDPQIAAAKLNLSVRINSKDANDPSKTFEIPPSLPSGASPWVLHPKFGIPGPNNVPVPDNDIAVVRINWEGEVKLLGAAFLASDEHTADTSKLKEIGASAGDGVFVLGFPMNLAGEQRNYVIIREGIISRISELLDKTSNSFLLDSFVFPGNSGGPVILKPEIAAIQGTTGNPRAYLVGVVIDYKTYIDTAISQNTHRPRITFEENSGLSDVIPIDRVNETIEAYRAQQK